MIYINPLIFIYLIIFYLILFLIAYLVTTFQRATSFLFTILLCNFVDYFMFADIYVRSLSDEAGKNFNNTLINASWQSWLLGLIVLIIIHLLWKRVLKYISEKFNILFKIYSLFATFMCIYYLYPMFLKGQFEMFYFFKNPILNYTFNFIIFGIAAINIYLRRLKHADDCSYFEAFFLQGLPFKELFKKKPKAEYSKRNKTKFNNNSSNYYYDYYYSSENDYSNEDNYSSEDNYEDYYYDNSSHKTSNDPYDENFVNSCILLGVDPDDSFEKIKSRYRFLAKNFHPDKNDDPESTEYLQKLNNAFDIIKKNKHQ